MPHPVALERYSRVAVALHWAMAALVLTNLAGGLIAANFEGELRRVVLDLHKSIGLVILGLSLVRLAWRLYRPPPVWAERRAAWERPLATSVHVAFYFLMVLTPLLGWWVSSATVTRHAIVIVGFHAPFLPVERGADLATAARDTHRVLAWTLMALLGLHIGAALRHRFIARDNALARMSLPPWDKKPA